MLIKKQVHSFQDLLAESSWASAWTPAKFYTNDAPWHRYKDAIQEG